MDELGGWLVRAANTRPVLGICFGHQLIARALGGIVERHVKGPEAGTVEVELTDAGQRDPLFAGLPVRFGVQQGHEDHVARLPPGAVLLARNDHTPVQAFAHGPMLRAIQFHPEFTAERSEAFVRVDRDWLDGFSPGLAEATLAGIRQTREASVIVANWASAFVRG